MSAGETRKSIRAPQTYKAKGMRIIEAAVGSPLLGTPKKKNNPVYLLPSSLCPVATAVEHVHRHIDGVSACRKCSQSNIDRMCCAIILV